MWTYQGRTALVTGGTGSLGQALVRRLAGAGLRVAFTYHTRPQAADELTAACGVEAVRAIRIETGDLAEARTVAGAVAEAWGPVDYLVNNLGAIRDRAFFQMEEADWREILRVNLETVFAFTRAVLFELVKRRRGAIVNCSSIAALLGASGQCNYAAAKAGVIGFSRSLAREIGRLGIRVNVVAPGYIESRMTTGLPPSVRSRMLELTPLGRFGTPEEVAAATAFLLSDQAAYVHGQVLAVDGGLSE